MPILDVETRWNSTYLMIERFIEIGPIIECLVNNNYAELQNLRLTTSDWMHIEVSFILNSFVFQIKFYL